MQSRWRYFDRYPCGGAPLIFNSLYGMSGMDGGTLSYLIFIPVPVRDKSNSNGAKLIMNSNSNSNLNLQWIAIFDKQTIESSSNSIKFILTQYKCNMN